MSEQPARLLIAQRMRSELVREIDHEIAVDRLLDDPRYARDVLLVCDALGAGDLATLAAMFREASAGLADGSAGPGQPHDNGPSVPGHARQQQDWGRDTSGFGMSEPAPLSPELPLGAGVDGRPLDRRRPWASRWRRG